MTGRFATFLLAAAVALDAQVAPPPATDLFISPMKFGPQGPLVGPGRNVSENPRGYDNQPFFGTDGRTLLFTSNRDGTQTDIYFIEMQTRQMRRLTHTPESEYSPTVMPEDAGVSAIRVEADGTQRLWKFGEAGSAPSVILPAVKPVGYHAWIDAGRVAVYVLGTPATLQIVDVASGKAETVASDIGRSLQRRPTGTITFVHREQDAWTVKEYDPVEKTIRPLVAALEGSPERDTAWGPDGTLFMTRGDQVFGWRPGQDGFRLAGEPGVGVLSRLAVSPDGRWMALVAAETLSGF